MKPAGLSLNSQIRCLTLCLQAERQALKNDLALAQSRTRMLLHTHPVLAVGLVLGLVLVWSKWRRLPR
ncbi:MAG: hypothetical protein ORN28_05730 [Rhodoferax sp.]|nr:hypothetical protein [Rhodoferax sp.]